jgi:hypothetical protein
MVKAKLARYAREMRNICLVLVGKPEWKKLHASLE